LGERGPGTKENKKKISYPPWTGEEGKIREGFKQLKGNQRHAKRVKKGGGGKSDYRLLAQSKQAKVDYEKGRTQR